MTNKRHTVLYTGSAADIVSRTLAHKKGLYEDAFTFKYKCFMLVWYEEYGSLEEAREQEARMKRWRREWKEELIATMDPEWKDLSEGWYDERDLIE